MSRPADRFDFVLNFRDVSNFVNTVASSERLKTGLLYRSARLDNTTEADRDKLVNNYKIRTVVDLRSKTEHINAAKKHSNAVAAAQSAAVPASDHAVAESLKIPGLHYAEINLNGKGFERSLIWQLKYRSLAKLVFLMAAGYRTDGIAVLGKEVMQPRGLLGLGIDTIDHSGPEIKEVFDVLTNEDSYPLLVHCTQGKDRTGLIVILVLLICDVPVAVVSSDYTKSESELEAEKEERMKEIMSIGLDETFAQCPSDFCEKMVAHLKDRYGSVEKYLEGIGVSYTQQTAVRRILLASKNEK